MAFEYGITVLGTRGNCSQLTTLFRPGGRPHSGTKSTWHFTRSKSIRKQRPFPDLHSSESLTFPQKCTCLFRFSLFCSLFDLFDNGMMGWPWRSPLCLLLGSICECCLNANQRHSQRWTSSGDTRLMRWFSRNQISPTMASWMLNYFWTMLQQRTASQLASLSDSLSSWS
jgi:hypothetical protein